MRSDGMPNSTPTAVAHRPPSSSADEQRHAVDAHHEVVGRVGADRHEGAGAERDLAAVADQDVEAERGEREDQERDQDRAEQVLVGDAAARRRRRTPAAAPIAIAVLQDREDLLVGAVARLELAVFAVEHGRELPRAQTRSMIFSPNSPCGRTSRKSEREHVGEPDLDAAAEHAARGRPPTASRRRR